MPSTKKATRRTAAARDWSVYIARCRDGSLYTGAAKGVERRLARHNAGRGAAYTSGRRPVRLFYREDGLTRSQALSREARIKALSRSEKEALAGPIA
ncbi:MAG: GIY-YIG nuclease family protein [Elusimicrobia bacterium]|nr:GIY-YIG nuclease family protein [Elusimicrobiota bacterium]